MASIRKYRESSPKKRRGHSPEAAARLLRLRRRTAGRQEELAEFSVGDRVNVHLRVLRGRQEREQIFSGVVVARRGSGPLELFTVRRIVAGEGVERTFRIHSPRIDKIEVLQQGKLRRSKLYYLRDRASKWSRATARGKGAKSETVLRLNNERRVELIQKQCEGAVLTPRELRELKHLQAATDRRLAKMDDRLLSTLEQFEQKARDVLDKDE
jgi:large subunit ribosomal protein L19